MTLDDRWMEQAKCRILTTEEADRVFFPPKRKGVNTDYGAAKKICRGCPVRTSCLAYSIAHNIPEGVWGGKSPNDRKRMNRELKVKYRKVWKRMHPLTRSQPHGRR